MKLISIIWTINPYIFILSLICLFHSSIHSQKFAIKYTIKDSTAMIANLNLLHDIPLNNDDSTINMIVEIPAGENQKWEVSKTGNSIYWEKKDSSLRIVEYLPYPGNYGMIPQTFEDTELNGDGDPLDIIVLGPAEKRGDILSVRVIGALLLSDCGETDDKIIGISSQCPCQINNIHELKKKYPGMIDIIKIWFENYKGKGKIKILNIAEKEKAMEIIQKNHISYLKKRRL